MCIFQKVIKMRNLLIFLIVYFIFQNPSFSIQQYKLYQLMSKAENEIAFYAIEHYCVSENPGVDIDSEILEQMHYSKPCKCAIKAGTTKQEYIAKDILEMCGLN